MDLFTSMQTSSTALTAERTRMNLFRVTWLMPTQPVRLKVGRINVKTRCLRLPRYRGGSARRLIVLPVNRSGR